MKNSDYKNIDVLAANADELKAKDTFRKLMNEIVFSVKNAKAKLPYHDSKLERLLKTLKNDIQTTEGEVLQSIDNNYFKSYSFTNKTD